MSAPKQTGGFVQGSAVASASGGREELFGEHGFSVRDQVPPKGRARFQAKLRRSQKWLLQRFRFSGSIAIVQIVDIPRPCRDTGPPHKAGFVFLGFRSPNRRESPAEGFSLFAIRVNVPDLCLVSCAPCAYCVILANNLARSYFWRTLKPTRIQDLCTQVSRFSPLKATTVFKTATLALSAVGQPPLLLDDNQPRLSWRSQTASSPMSRIQGPGPRCALVSDGILT
jgi:hypothetical protein